ncbi:Demethylrebeccamycin-D-glucose O-methyltransferase [Roseovarius albus]|uniref:Demethylrebeccamycin-D-glucose O-methyltransferase n=1 Tax=Roseovarius albus TaxID=1247867 RepID=A0A1X6YGI9_9RHOB|nr:class I SAM-dependent methyltransferase [Roseovarius albus]SLN20312.1 Demethylrebeccamycin-D-glucose O-methyltransferase [Roseovarius albus]
MSSDKDGLSPEALRQFGTSVDFGQTAHDYANHRAGFPLEFFDLLAQRRYACSGQTALDLGCGTGTVARGLAHHGLQVTGIDPASDLLGQARVLDKAAGVEVQYRTGTAEDTGSADQSVDLVTTGQCWHWFDRPRAAAEVKRVLRPGGRLVIAHFDWLPLPGNVVEKTEELILKHNPLWAGANGTGLYPAWLTDLANAGFDQLETASFDLSQPYGHIGWRGRIRASAGVAASLSDEQTKAFDQELFNMLTRDFPKEPLAVPHRIWIATGVRPQGKSSS